MISVRSRVVFLVACLLVIEGVFLRYTVFSSDESVQGEAQFQDSIEELKLQHLAKLQVQQEEIQELQNQLRIQQMLVQQQRQQEVQEEENMRESELLKVQMEVRLESPEALSDAEWESLRKNVTGWQPNVVSEWARRVCGLDDEEVSRVFKLKLCGPDLLKQTKEDFLLAGFPLGPATKLYDAVLVLLKNVDFIKRSPTIAIVGAGFSGIATAREVAENGGTPILIEEAKKPGGIWIYDDHPKTVSGYNSLFAQGAASDVNFRGWVIPPDAPRMLSIHQISDHINSFWDNFGLSKYVVYNTHVMDVEPLWDKKKELPANWMDPLVVGEETERLPQLRVHFNRTVYETKFEDQKSINVTRYEIGFYDVDGVVVCVGRNHIPVLPSTDPQDKSHFIPGLDSFTGKSIHSREYRLSTDFQNTTVIVSGGGKSAQDIAADLVQNPSLHVIHSSSHLGQRNRIVNITKQEDGSFTVYFSSTGNAKSNGEERIEPVHNVGGIIWCWGFLWRELPVGGNTNPPGGYYYDVLYKDFPGITRVGTQGILSSAVCVLLFYNNRTRDHKQLM